MSSLKRYSISEVKRVLMVGPEVQKSSRHGDDDAVGDGDRCGKLKNWLWFSRFSEQSTVGSSTCTGY